MRWPHPRTLWMAVPQVPVKWLLQKANDMFPEGQGGPRRFAKGGTAAEMTNELLENATAAIDKLFRSPDACTAVDKGCGRNFFSRERCAAPRFARVPLTLAHLLLSHRRLDGRIAATRAPAPIKIRCESEQTLSVQRYMRPGSIVNAIT